MIECTWISRLLRDAAFTWRPKELSCRLRKWRINFAIRTVHVLKEYYFDVLWVLRAINSTFCSKTCAVTDVFVGFRPSNCAHPVGHQHGVFIQISANLGKTFLLISRIWNISLSCILARFFSYLPPFISLQILDFIHWTVLILTSINFEGRDTENQQYHFCQKR